MYRLSRLAATALVACVAMTGSAAAQRLSLSTWGSPKHYQVAEFVPLFEKLLKEKSGGKLRLKIFEGGEMVKQAFVPTAIPQGTIDISLTTLDNWSGRVPDVGIVTTPLWDKSMEWTLKNLRPGNAVFDFFNTKLSKEGAVILAMLDIGGPALSLNFEVKSVDSLKNMPIRAYSKGSAELLQTLGAVPTIIGVGDVYSALQRGTVKGAMGGLGGAVGLKHYEVTSEFFIANGALGTLTSAYVMNKEKFDSLSPELRKALRDAATEARDHTQKALLSQQSKLLDQVRAAGKRVSVLQPGSALWNEFTKRLEPLTASARKTYSKEAQAVLAKP
ncbi:MAG: TRAP transporter substrate-binding protein DctP [Hyphomicrobiaceae bacterium]